jgi:hypothetical protein
MKETIIFPVLMPIQKPGRTYDKKSPNFRAAYGKSGVYIIFKQTQRGLETMYIGSSKDAGRQCARKFYPFKDIIGKEEINPSLFAGYNAEGRSRVTFADQKKNAKFFVKFFLYGDTKEITEATRKKIYDKEYILIKQLQPKYNSNNTDPESENLEKQAEIAEQAEEAAERFDEYKEEYKEYLKAENAQTSGENTDDLPEPKEPIF